MFDSWREHYGITKSPDTLVSGDFVIATQLLGLRIWGLTNIFFFAISPQIPYNTSMRLMGIDFGTKKVGVAFTDESGAMAFPHGVVPNSSKLLDVLTGLIDEKGVTEIVIGHSLGKDGKANVVQAGIDALVLDLTLQTGLPVHLVPEQYTTQAALRIQGRNDQTDASAAALILDNFIITKKK